MLFLTNLFFMLLLRLFMSWDKHPVFTRFVKRSLISVTDVSFFFDEVPKLICNKTLASRLSVCMCVHRKPGG